MPTYGETPSTLHMPHHAIRATHVSEIRHTDTNLRHGHRRQCVSSEIEVGSIYPTMQELRAAAAKQADTCVAGVAWCVMREVEGVSRTSTFV